MRRDLVSGDWIVIAPGRGRRPHDFIKNKPMRTPASKRGCPFDNPQESGNVPYLAYPSLKEWKVQIIQNKYPAVIHSDLCGTEGQNGPYAVFPGIGHHDVIITRDHYTNFPHLSTDDAHLVFQAFRDRYLMLHNDQCLSYISIFHNWGRSAGASIYHPHFQLIAIPVVPPDVSHSLEGSRKYWEENKKCVHCVMIDWERKKKVRVVYENKGAIAFTPFVSRNPFEVRIFPKTHLPYFENTYDHDMAYVVDALQNALLKIEKNLADADYNFFIHTAPLQNKSDYTHYHWHIEVYPKISIDAGFELGTGIDINAVDPDLAAKGLRKRVKKK